MLIVAVAWLVWLGAPGSEDVPAPAETAAPFDPAVVDGIAEESEPDALFDAPILPLAQPRADDTSIGAGSELPATTGHVSIIVTVRVDGRPLEEVLRGLLQSGLFQNPARAIATHDPVGPEIDATGAHTSHLLSLGEFSTLRDWFDGDAEPGRPPGCLGVLEVPEQFPLYVSVLLGSAVIAETRLDAPREELVFEMSSAQLDAVMGGIRLRVTSKETGQPIDHARIEYGFQNSMSANADPMTGHIVERMVPGPVTLRVQAPGHEWMSIATRVPCGRSRDLGDVALHKACRLAGVVLQPDGAPAPDAHAWLVPIKSKLDAFSLFDIESHVQDGGHFDLLKAGPRQYLLVATDFTNAVVMPIDMRKGDLVDVQLRMQPLTRLDVSLPPEPLATVRLRIWTESGVPVSSWPDSTTERSSTEWTVPLVPGAYVLAINSARHGRMTKDVTVGTAPSRIDLAELLK